MASSIIARKFTASAQAIASSSAFTKMKSIPAKYPFGFGVILSGCKTSFSDLLVQKVIERKEEIDWKRNSAFAAFGFIYLGGVQYMLYVPIFSRLFPGTASFVAKPFAQKLRDVKGMMQVTAQVFLDQCVHHPLMYFPAFYCTKELVMNTENPDFTKVLSNYRENLTDDLKALWKIWVPCTFVNFTFMPMHLRIPFVAGVSLVWTCVLSATRGGDVVHGEDMAGGAVTGSTYSLLKEGLDERFNVTPVELDIEKCHMNVSAVGKSKPGLVAMLARHVADHEGNVTHSKMVRLGQEFIIQMHVAVPPEQKLNLVNSLQNDKQLSKSLDINTTLLTRRDTDCKVSPKAVVGIHMFCIGDDK